MSNPPAPTSDERIMAALSHLFGPLVSLIVWATQKDKSAFVRFQSLQALAADLILMVVSMGGVICAMVLMFGSIILGVAASSRNADPNSVTALYMAPFLIWLPLPPSLAPASRRAAGCPRARAAPSPGA
jgi:uncharacterized Tic20 family protein